MKSMTMALFAAALLVSAPLVCAQQAPSLSFTLEAQAGSTVGQVIPKLSWTTTPAATSCTAAGATDWTGTKTASGTITLAPIAPPKSYSLACTWPGDSTVTLTWTAPTKNTDGTDYTNPAGYRIFYGASASALTQTVELRNPALATYDVTSLTPGEWFFAIRSFATTGAESVNSAVASSRVAAPFSVTQTVDIRKPAAPTSLSVQ